MCWKDKDAFRQMIGRTMLKILRILGAHAEGRSFIAQRQVRLQRSSCGTKHTERESVERATRIELVTSSLGSWHSTAELRPLSVCDCAIATQIFQVLFGQFALNQIARNG
jgi:hypothetical protein